MVKVALAQIRNRHCAHRIVRRRLYAAGQTSFFELRTNIRRESVSSQAKNKVGHFLQQAFFGVQSSFLMLYARHSQPVLFLTMKIIFCFLWNVLQKVAASLCLKTKQASKKTKNIEET